MEEATAVMRVTDDDVGFAAVLSMDLGRAFRTAAAILGNEADAQDAVQSALERAWKNWYRVHEPSAGRAWFWQILVNSCRETLRTRRRHPAQQLEPDWDVPGSDPFRASLARDAVGRAMNALNPEQRTIVALRFWGDLSIPEIATRLGIPEGTVKSRLHGAIAVLRREVGRDEEANR